jgi:hypothetical protein
MARMCLNVWVIRAGANPGGGGSGGFANAAANNSGGNGGSGLVFITE